MKKSRFIIILSLIITGIALSACSSQKPVAVVRGPEQAEVTEPTFWSKWVRDRSKDYAAEAPRPPIQLRNKQMAEAFSEEYKIPGE